MRRIRTASRIAVPLLVLAISGTLLAEKPNSSSETLQKTATHIVTGKVVTVYSRVSMHGAMKVTRHVAEVKVGEVEKGEGVTAGQLLYVRYWEQEWTGSDEDMPAGTNGHSPLPVEGADYRIHLAQNAPDGFGAGSRDGGFDVIGRNGFAKLESKD